MREFVTSLDATFYICPVRKPESRCVGLSCMAWRWWHGVIDANQPKDQRPQVGYCGLAGKPWP